MGELDELKVAQGTTWSAGGYQALGRLLMPVSERLCEAIDLRSPWTVPDAATGAGNTALAVARHGCQVAAVDIAAGLLDRAHIHGIVLRGGGASSRMATRIRASRRKRPTGAAGRA